MARYLLVFWRNQLNIQLPMKFLEHVFHPAKSRKTSWNLFKTLLETSLFWLIFLYLCPKCILWLEQQINFPTTNEQPLIGWGIFVLFGILGISSGITMSWIGKGTPLPMDCPNILVVKGPYRIVRNPMAVAGISQGIGVGLIFGSYAIILYAIAGGVLWHVAVRPSEEKDLEQRFGKSYLEYKKQIWCWIPTFAKYPPTESSGKKLQ